MQGFHCLYLISPKGQSNPCKFGIADNAHARAAALQVGNWVELEVRKWWWLAGKLLTIRIETELIERLCRAERHIRGEWFDISAEEAAPLAEQVLDEMRLPWITEERLRQFEDEAIDRAVKVSRK